MAQSKASCTYLALLRGINVGGKNKLPMKDLTGLFIDAGCSNVRTFIQSGNVIFSAARGLVEKLPSLITKRIEERVGYKIPVILRTAEELNNAICKNPFLAAGALEKTLHVYFLASLPDARDVAALDPHRSPPDTFLVRDREIYVQLPNGRARTKLTNAYFDSRLSTTSTARNWNTVLQLHELMKD
jgi:uncharacterized protein (DUF1697 family)